MESYSGSELNDEERAATLEEAAALALKILSAHPAASLEELELIEPLGEQLLVIDKQGLLPRATIDSILIRWYDQISRLPRSKVADRILEDAIWVRLQDLQWRGSTDELLQWADDEVADQIRSINGPDWEASLWGVRSECHSLMGNHRAALAEIERARQRECSGAFLESKFIAIAINLGRFDEASQAIGRLSSMASSEGSSRVAKSCLYVATAAFRYGLGDYDGCVAVIDERIDSLPGSLQSLMAIRRCMALSNLAKTPGERRAALEELNFRIARPVPTPDWQRSLRLARIRLWARGSDPEQWSEALRETDRLLREIDSAPFVDDLRRARVIAWRARILRHLGIPDSWSAGELSRHVRIYTEMWRSIGDLWGGLGFLQFFDKRVVVAEALRQEAQVSGAASAVDLWLDLDRCSSIGQRIKHRGLAPDMKVDAAMLQAACKEHGATLVIVVPAPLESIKFVVTGNSITQEVLEGSAEFESRLAPVRSWLRRRPRDKDGPDKWPNEELNWLSTRLIPAELPSAIWFAGLDGLGWVPTEALRLKTGEFLGLEIPSVHQPSVQGALQLSMGPVEREDQTRRKGLIFTADDQEQGAQTIDLNTRESVELAGASGGRLRIVGRSGTTLDSFNRAIRSGADFLGIWSHGDYDRQLLVPSTLRLGSGLQLNAEQLEQSILSAPVENRPDVIYLAACMAAQGPIRQGDGGSSHLGGVALGAGVPAALVSPKRNERDATLVHLRGFIGSFIRDGHSAQDALLAARREVALSRKEWAHPHFWAGLQVVGWGPTTATGN